MRDGRRLWLAMVGVTVLVAVAVALPERASAEARSINGAYVWADSEQAWHWQHDVVPANAETVWSGELSTWVHRPDFDGVRRAHGRIEKASSRVVGRDVQVGCAAGGQWKETRERFIPNDDAVAFALVEASVVMLPASLCKTLKRIAKGKRVGLRATAAAVAIWAHELGHISGVYDEGRATCWGIGKSKKLARGLGAPKPYKVRRAVRRDAFFWAASQRCQRF